MSRTENLVRVVSYLALIAGIPATLVLGWILFVPGEAVCDGATMSPGQTCGLPFAEGDSYEQMVTETTVRRALAHVAVGLAALGIVGVAGIETYRHKQGPAPEWFTPETTLGDKSFNIAPQVLTRALTTYTARLADHQATLGPDHPETLTWRYNLANVLVLAGDTTRAVSLYESVAAARGHTLGPDHPDTFAAQAGVAYAHAMSDDPDKAIPLAQGLLARGSRILPVHDPRIRTASRSLSLAEARVANDGGDGPRPPAS
ncbi:tetratricopeptide repeat protein [Promicromonospora sp. NPDC050249]|uniref:tetratricopeptide repeat protein n=1 Tax=Promicromonospora sp. NPDC050249 TaxID=3154743 RepID=UPI0033E7739F